MTATWDVIVVGGGVNGLVCAACLARAGRRPLVLEARAEVGGGAATSEIAPGFRVPRLSHVTGPLSRDLLARLQIPSSDLSFVQSPVDLVGLSLDGDPVVIYGDPARTSAGLGARAPHDRDAWPAFVRSRAAIARIIGSLFTSTPPALDDLGGRDAWQLLRTARGFRALAPADRHRLLRWGPMAVADLVSECFEDELLRATVAADGIVGSMLGPWSAGSGMQLLLSAANETVGDAHTRYLRGGPGQLAAVLARIVESAGGRIRTGARALRILARDERVTGVALASGEELACRTVISAVDPKRTLLDLCDAADLPPELSWRARNYRTRGVLAKLNVALSSLPDFRGASREVLSGRVRIGPDLDYIERAFDHAKYGRYSPAPWMEVVIPSLLDESLAPAGAHVLSVYVQFAPHELRDRTWDQARDGLHTAALDTLEQYAPGLRPAIVASEILTPADLEREWGFTGGHIFHGELALDQLWAMRPLLGWAGYRGPIDGLFLCGSGTHPGTGMTGLSGLNAAREILRHREATYGGPRL